MKFRYDHLFFFRLSFSLFFFGILYVPPIGWGQSEQPSQRESPIQESTVPAPATSLSLDVGEIQSLKVEGITRIVIGNPAVVDVSIPSTNEVLLQAKAAGATKVMLWSGDVQHVWEVHVIDRAPETTENQLRQVISQLNMPSVRVQREGGKLFLVGEVPTKADLDRVEQLLKGFPEATNLVAISAAAPPSPEQTPPLVKLGVQVIEMNRDDMEKLGVSWDKSIDFTEQSATVPPEGEFKANEGVVGPVQPLTKRIGKAFHVGRLLRHTTNFSLNALLTEKRARLLAEPKLVTASGKEASSFVGIEAPIIQSATVSSGGITLGIDYRKTGVILKMTPTVKMSDPNRSITTVMEAEVSSVDKTSGIDLPVAGQHFTVPAFNVRKANTEVSTIPGETIIIAGLLKAEDTNESTEVPGLGRMPVVGRLFRTPETQGHRQELVIAVTPELMSDEGNDVDRTLALEQALSVTEVTPSIEDPRLRYALEIQDRIARVLHYPPREKDLDRVEGTVQLRLHLFADGTLGRATVSKSSGIESLDQAALKAAESQSPYPGFPSQLTERELWLDLPVIFRPS